MKNPHQYSLSRAINAASAGVCTKAIAKQVITNFIINAKDVMLAGGELRLHNFGTLRATITPERVVRNPKTGLSQLAPAGRVKVRFIKSKNW
jgi:nucleoid DNA-binding protein